MVAGEATRFDPAEYDPRMFSSPRLSNRQAVVGLIRVSAGITRSELAIATGISKSATAQLVAELLDANLVVEVQDVPHGGRRSAVLRPVLPDFLVAGIQLKAESIVVGLADMNGDPIETRVERIDVRTPMSQSIERAGALLTQLTVDRGSLDSPLGAVVVAVPALVGHEARRDEHPRPVAMSLPTDAMEPLGLRLDVPVHMDNDANLGAWGERERGAAHRYQNAIYIEASEGVGAGLIVNGRVFTGAAGFAGEIGHYQIDRSGPLCWCGQNGCLNVMLSSGRIADRLRQARGDDTVRPLAAYTDAVSQRILRNTGYMLGEVIANAANTLNPEAVIIGGDLSDAHPALHDGIREGIARYAMPATAGELVVTPAALRSEAVLRGCFIRGTHSVFAREVQLEAQGMSLPRKADGLVCTRAPSAYAV